MHVSDQTPTKEITISGHEFIVPAPYSAGHSLTENEAAVLNQTLAENLRNNFAPAVKKAKDAAGEGGQVDVASLQAELNKYVTEYEFGVRRTGSGSAGPKLEPRERIALNLAKIKVKEAIVSKGRKVSEFAADAINELATNLVAKDPSYLQEADRQIKQTQKIAKEEISLDDLALAPAKEPAAE